MIVSWCHESIADSDGWYRGLMWPVLPLILLRIQPGTSSSLNCHLWEGSVGKFIIIGIKNYIPIEHDGHKAGREWDVRRRIIMIAHTKEAIQKIVIVYRTENESSWLKQITRVAQRPLRGVSGLCSASEFPFDIWASLAQSCLLMYRRVRWDDKQFEI